MVETMCMPELIADREHISVRVGTEIVHATSHNNIWSISLQLNGENYPEYRKDYDSVEALVYDVTGIFHMTFDEMEVGRCPVTFSEFVVQWLDDRDHVWEEETYNNRKKAVSVLIVPFFEDKKVEEIWKEDFEKWEDWVEDQCRKDVKKSEAATVMREALESLWLQNYYPYNAARHLKRTFSSGKKMVPKRKKPIPDEVARMLFTGNELLNLMAVFTLAFRTRRGETCGARWKNVDRRFRQLLIDSQIKQYGYDLKYVNHTKGRRDRIELYTPHVQGFLDAVALDQKIRDRLSRCYSNPDGYIFTDDNGSPISPDWFTDAVRELTDGKVSPHDIRRLAATRIYEDRRPEAEFCTSDLGRNLNLLYAIADDLGHEDIRTTCRYILSSESGLKEISQKTTAWRNRFFDTA